MGDISAFGTSVILVASETFPTVGIEIDEFADDVDAIAFEPLQVGDHAMGLNGDLVTWSTPNAILMTIAVIPGGANDRNLSILAEANRVGKGKRAVLDTITGTKVAPGEEPVIYTNGKMIQATPSTGAQQGGRKGTKTFQFAFENKVGFD